MAHNGSENPWVLKIPLAKLTAVGKAAGALSADAKEELVPFVVLPGGSRPVSGEGTI